VNSFSYTRTLAASCT